MNKKIGFIILAISFVITVGVFWTQNKEKPSIDGTQVMNFVDEVRGVSHSDFRFQTVKNETIEIDVEDNFFKIKGMEEKTVFLKVFGWDCKFCKKEIPELVTLKNELGDSFEIVAIEAQHFSTEESLEFMKQYGVNYPVTSGDSQTDFYTYLQEKYGWSGVIPLTIVLAKGGKVLAFEVGDKSYSLAELMKASLARE
ncbi:MAG TPA: TlpA family protein disulfide reductase [Campylobacterales bacterium]|nr:TlpA family protein disulfide reductase [Campylobacterales bacterium]HHS92034.1 TlpA family protein disulfide reductase [Campylobacterales bacterium]